MRPGAGPLAVAKPDDDVGTVQRPADRLDPVVVLGACKRIGEQLGIKTETLRSWVIQAEIDGDLRSGTTSDDTARLIELEKEFRELRRANSILRTSTALSAAEVDRPSR